jgi:hypothetical protein
MRTKALILSAALVAAGVASSMAQSNVYSLNVVGYVNINLQPGYSLITLPLQSADPTSSINSVLTNSTPVIPGGAFVYQWDPVHSDLAPAVYAGGDGNWYDQTYNYLQTNSLPPGESFYIYMPTIANGGVANCTVTVVGTVLQGTNSYTENTGYGFYGNFEPIQGDILTNLFPVTESGSFCYTWNYSTQSFNPAVYAVTAADNGTPLPQFYDQTYNTNEYVIPAVGQGFVYFNAGAAAPWTQVFTVQ